MNSSHAIIPYDANKAVAKIQENSRPKRGRWALVLNALPSLSPGRTLDQIYTTLGEIVEKHANRAAHKLGLGPHVVSQRIKSHFGSGEGRVRQLELLRTSVPAKLQKHCFKLLKYTFPAESVQTQCQAFQAIVDLVTLLPGLRALFLHAKFLHGATSPERISRLWVRHDNASTSAEWKFWNNFAATCLSPSDISTIVQERSIGELMICGEEGLGVIALLLIERNCSGSFCCSSALCIRYLAGIVDLPGFWLNMGIVHAHVANKLCREMVLVLKDVGVDILVLGYIDALESESPFDYDGVDFLAITLLMGLSTWFRKLDPEDWSAQPWYESFTAFLLLLRRPRATELLPRSSACAASDFENILPCVYEDAELTIKVVDGENESPDNLGAIHDDTPANLRNTNNPTIGVHSRVSEQDDEHNLDSSSQRGGDSRSEGSDVDSLEASRSEADTSDEESCNCIDQSDVADLHMQDVPRNGGIDLIAEGGQMLSADEESVRQEISANDNSTAETLQGDEKLIEREHSAPDELIRNQLGDSMSNPERSNALEAAPALDSTLGVKQNGESANPLGPLEDEDRTLEPIAKDESAPVELLKRLDDTVTNIASERHGVLEGDPGGMTQSDDAGLHVHDVRSTSGVPFPRTASTEPSLDVARSRWTGGSTISLILMDPQHQDRDYMADGNYSPHSLDNFRIQLDPHDSAFNLGSSPFPHTPGSYHNSPYSGHSELSFSGEQESFSPFADDEAPVGMTTEYDPSEYDAPQQSSLLMFNDNDYMPGPYDHSRISSVPVGPGPDHRGTSYDYSSPSSNGGGQSDASGRPSHVRQSRSEDILRSGSTLFPPDGGAGPDFMRGNQFLSPIEPPPSIRSHRHYRSVSSGGSVRSERRGGSHLHNRRRQATFICPVPGCGSTFTRSFNLKGHIRSHNEEKPFLCKWPGCGKGFARQHDCKRHEQLHTNYWPFTCEGCKKSFARMDALNRHLRSQGGAECQRMLEANERLRNFSSGGNGSRGLIPEHGHGGGRARSYSTGNYLGSPHPPQLRMPGTGPKMEDSW